LFFSIRDMNKKKISKTKVSHLKSHIGYHLRVVSNEVSQSFSRNLKKFDVTVAEWVILREILSLGTKTSSSVLAEFTGLSRGAVSKLIDRLLHKGLVTRTEMTEDRRYQDISLTTKSRKLIPELSKTADQNDEKYFSLLSESERDQLIKTLIKLKDAHNLNTNPIK
jgi:DNA-binding MarR family transcriptional regulator